MKGGMKQQNLFGHLILEDSDKGSGVKGKQKLAGKEKAKTDPKKKSKSPLPGATDRSAAKGKGSDSQETQMEDEFQAASNLDSQVQEVETQLGETQLDGSSPTADTEVETQPTTETQTEEEDTQVDEDEPVSSFVWTSSHLRAEYPEWDPIRLLSGWLHRHERQRWSRNLSEQPLRGFLATGLSSRSCLLAQICIAMYVLYMAGDECDQRRRCSPASDRIELGTRLRRRSRNEQSI